MRGGAERVYGDVLISDEFEGIGIDERRFGGWSEP